MTKASKKIKVLIVDDNKTIRKIYSLTFMQSGFTVYTASNGRTAIQKYRKKKPDIILLDIMMPKTDGYEVLKEIRKNFKPYTPVIMLTNLGNDEFKRRSQLDHIDAYLIKSDNSLKEILDKTTEVLKMNNIIAVT